MLEDPDSTMSLGMWVCVKFSVLWVSHDLHTAQEQQDVRGCKGQQNDL